MPSGMNENKIRRNRRNEELAKTFSLIRAEAAMNEEREEEKYRNHQNLLKEINRLAKEVKDLVDGGKLLDEAIDQVVNENADCLALSKQKTADPKKSLLNWYNRNYPNHQVRDDDDER